MPSTLVPFFQHNLWANLRLLDACAQLDDRQLHATLPGTFGTVQETLQHIGAAEELNLHRLTGEQPEAPLYERKEMPGIAELRARLQRTGEGFITVAERWQPGQMVRLRFRGESYEVPAIIVLLQVINHATDHRSQVATILSQQGVVLPGIDGWTFHAEGAGTAEEARSYPSAI